MLNLIGNKLRQARKDKNMTLKELSKKTGLSIGLLSNVERNISIPKLLNLQKICTALDVTMHELLVSSHDNLVVKKEDRKIVYSEKSREDQVVYEALSDGNHSLRGMCMIVKDHGTIHESFGHKTDEFGIIISGEMIITIRDEEILLKEGDSIIIPAGYIHSFKKTSSEDCVSYWVMPSLNSEKA